jgi:hypothetical protein
VRCTIDRVELRQLSYFVAVAEELHFGRASERLHISGPSLSQQISNLERELGTQLLVRDRRHVELTPAGSQFLTDPREVLASATRAFDRARKGGGEHPLRLGYVSWLPPEATAIPDPRIRIDEWVLPSHTQAGRVDYGSLDLGIAWVEEADIARLSRQATTRGFDPSPTGPGPTRPNLGPASHDKERSLHMRVASSARVSVGGAGLPPPRTTGQMNRLASRPPYIRLERVDQEGFRIQLGASSAPVGWASSHWTGSPRPDGRAELPMVSDKVDAVAARSCAVI